ncbi:hypothetical protein C5167_001015 [Papaver somniferum]|uniref:Uncharacterized protein n=1 Tax=Papaver somniferum TaxID=3469 RepID=A0A4Y7KVR5_PAPSO|nr:hypothetical protein C5167_001015 [Papaver somniferum]
MGNEDIRCCYGSVDDLEMAKMGFQQSIKRKTRSIPFQPTHFTVISRVLQHITKTNSNKDIMLLLSFNFSAPAAISHPWQHTHPANSIPALLTAYSVAYNHQQSPPTVHLHHDQCSIQILVLPCNASTKSSPLSQFKLNHSSSTTHSLAAAHIPISNSSLSQYHVQVHTSATQRNPSHSQAATASLQPAMSLLDLQFSCKPATHCSNNSSSKPFPCNTATHTHFNSFSLQQHITDNHFITTRSWHQRHLHLLEINHKSSINIIFSIP